MLKYGNLLDQKIMTKMRYDKTNDIFRFFAIVCILVFILSDLRGATQYVPSLTSSYKRCDIQRLGDIKKHLNVTIEGYLRTEQRTSIEDHDSK